MEAAGTCMEEFQVESCFRDHHVYGIRGLHHWGSTALQGRAVIKLT